MQLKKLLMMVFILINLISFSEINLVNTENKIIGKVYEKFDNINQEKTDLYKGYILNLSDFDEELCYLCLGTIRNYDLIEEISQDIGVLLKRKNVDFIIFGNLEPVSENKDNKLNYIAKSPYIISEIIYKMMRGFETSGIYPVLNINSKSNKNTIDSLLSKSGSFLSYSNEISDVDFFRSENEIQLLKNYNLKLNWSLYKENFNSNIAKIFENSIVLTGFRKDNNILLYRKLNYSNDRSVTFFSEKVREKAENVLNGTEQPTGNKNW